MRNPRAILLTFCMLILIGAFSNCSKMGFFDINSVAEKVTTPETVVGNPLTTASKTLLSQLCSVLTRCHILTTSACESGVLNTNGIDYQLGLQKGSVATFSEIVQTENSGLLPPNTSALNACVNAIDELSCADASVQGAYDSSSNSFAGVAYMIPTNPGSCTWIFNQPTISRNEYYVSPSGNDFNNGSKEMPWATIDHASEALSLGSEGAIVHVAPGEYNLSVKSNCGNNISSCGIKTTRSGTAQAPIVYISDSQWKAKLTAPGASAIWHNTGDHIRIIGFELIGSSTTNFGVYSAAAFGQFVGNHIHDIPVPSGCSSDVYGGGIFFSYNSSSHDNDVNGNWIHDIGPLSGMSDAQYCGNHALGIHYNQARGKVINNILHRVSGYAISTSNYAQALLISHNLLFNNGVVTTSGTMHGGAILISGSSQSPHSNTTVANNILRNNIGHVVFEYDQVANSNKYINNILYANTDDQFRLVSTVTPVGTLITDPNMIDFKLDGSGNYRLQNSSAARDSASNLCSDGSSNCNVTNDFAGATRPIGSSADIGPYEWHP